MALKDQLDRLELRAPMDGRIYQVTVHTVCGIVNPGDALMLLAPDARALTIEAKIATRNIDQIYPGQAVNLRFTAFDQRTTPEVAEQYHNLTGCRNGTAQRRYLLPYPDFAGGKGCQKAAGYDPVSGHAS